MSGQKIFPYFDPCEVDNEGACRVELLVSTKGNFKINLKRKPVSLVMESNILRKISVEVGK